MPVRVNQTSVPASQAIVSASRHQAGTARRPGLIAGGTLASGLEAAAGARSPFASGGVVEKARGSSAVDAVSSFFEGCAGIINCGRDGSGGSFLLAATSGFLAGS